MALEEAIEKFNDGEELKRTAVAQVQRISELEKELEKLKSGSPPGKALPSESDRRKRLLLETIVERLRKGEINLPSYPETSMKLSGLIRDQAGIGQVAHMLEEDVAIAAKLIGISNSVRYRGLKPSQSVEHAITVLGLWATKNFADLIANRALYVVKTPRFRPALTALWEHSVACAHAARAIAKLGNFGDSDELFTMGMLHET